MGHSPKVFISFLLFLSLIQCSSVPHTQKTLWGNDRALFFPSVQYRRPSSLPVEPWEAFDLSQPASQEWDCHPLSQLFEAFPRAEFLDCLKAIQAGTLEKKEALAVVYRLNREGPLFFLELSQPESFVTSQTVDPGARVALDPSVGSCLNQKIPVPREIFFQGQQAECFSARIPLQSESLWGRFNLAPSWKLHLSFPLSQFPRSDGDLRKLLSSWVLSFFLELKKTGVPEKMCRLCFGKTPLSSQSSLPVWPSTVPEGNEELPIVITTPENENGTESDELGVE